MNDDAHPAPEPETAAPSGIDRRRFLTGTGALVAGGLAAKMAYDRNERFLSAQVFIARAAAYDLDLADVIRRGLTELGLGPKWADGKRVLLKPNLVEPSPDAPHINTHPAVVRAAAEVFRGWGAARVLVAEGQGHCRDTMLVLEQSGMEPMLNEAKLDFVDLNHDELFAVANRFNRSTLAELVLPETLRIVDLVVSLPKMKTHHWAGVTLSMKNLFGVMPGIYYGWPKNVLHHAGIGESIQDITATVRPQLAIVDGIVGMEGDGPIMGAPKQMGVLVMGTNLPAVDATATRLMGLDPRKISYLVGASGKLGPIAESRIEQRGETIIACRKPFRLLDDPHFDQFRG